MNEAYVVLSFAECEVIKHLDGSKTNEESTRLHRAADVGFESEQTRRSSKSVNAVCPSLEQCALISTHIGA